MESWKRCKNMGVNPKHIKLKTLSHNELNDKISNNLHLIKIVKPYFDYLFLRVTNIPFLIALADSKAWIINISGNVNDFGEKKFRFCLGSNCSEKYIGNNGIGTCLTCGKPIIIYGREHFVNAYASFTCIGVPIKVNKKIVGAIDVCIPNKYAHPSIFDLTISCVESIQSTLSIIDRSSIKNSPNMNLSRTSKLLATAVHDLKNPLSVIRGLGQLGKLTSDKAKADYYFDKVIKQADELNTMVVELLSIFSPPKIKPMEISKIIKDVIEEFEPQCNSKKISLNIINSNSSYANISEPLFKRAIRNLISNAIQAIDIDGSIEIKIKQENKHIILSITDTAGGIPEELRDNLFEPFTFKRSGGTGLGLFMVYHTITNTHNGEMWFHTTPGNGTTFFIKLPIANPTSDLDMDKYNLMM
nr:HAMP domain-containing sensor histidine kinase [Clostridium acetobutylicum]